jgi:hypothetical protein
VATDHISFKAPPDREAKLWRYTDLAKYVSLLETQSLYFSRADLVGDPFEGSVSQATIERRRKAFRSAPAEQKGDHSEEIHLGIYASLFKRMQALTFLNCWHMNESESVAMWRLYASSGVGVAIQTTFSKLFRITPSNVFIGVVHYDDYEQSDIPDDTTFDAFLHKRRSFAHENEVRAVLQHDYRSTDPTLPGKLVPVSLPDLIDVVCVSPSAPDWHLAIVRSLTMRYGLSKPVLRSEIDSRVLF